MWWNDQHIMDSIDIQGAFAHASEALRIARRFHNDGLYEEAVLWFYTTVVYAARAILLLHERRVHTHAQLRRAFAVLVRSGRIDTEQLHILMRVQACRINLDLNAHGPLFLTAEKASPVVRDGAQFLACIHRYLQHAGIDVAPSDSHTQCSDGSPLCVA